MPTGPLADGVPRTSPARWLTDEEQRAWRAYIRLAQLLMRQLDRDLHAPPPVRFLWGPLRFDAVIEKLSQKFTLFRPDGTPARATLSVTFKEYLPIQQ